VRKLKQRESEIIRYDFQCSAQKPVSIMAIVCGDERLIEAHRRAVREAFAELEGLAAMQMGQWMARDTTGASSRWLWILTER
jgi:conjugative relaxase-like TrwC/TraI family protein